MKPEHASHIVLGTTRARAKMHEYAVPPSEYNRIPRSPSILFSLTIGILGDVAASRITGQSQSERMTETKSHLLFCARFFDSYVESRLDTPLDPYMLLLASATYYLAELPGSAAVIASRLPSPGPELQANGLDALLAWTLAGDYTTDLTLPRETHEGAENVRSLLSSFFASGTGADELSSAINALRRSVYRNGTARELLLADLIAAVVQTRLSNSTWSTLPRYSQLAEEMWAPVLQKPGFVRELWPAQRLLGEQGLYLGESAVIQMPTSAGKTRALDLIIRGAFYSGRTSLAFVVAPFRALCEEIRQSLSRAFSGEPVNVDALSDVQQADFVLSALLSRQQVLVMTPEKCLYLLRHNPEIADSLGLLVYDEGHQFDSGKRGVTYELLLTSLKGMVSPSTQTVLVSAVLNNAQAIADWLLGAGAKVVVGTNLLPTTRALAFVSWQDQLGRLEFQQPTNPDINEFFVPRIIERQTLRRFPRERIDRVFPEHDSMQVGLYLALKIAASGGVAVFVGTKPSATSMARKAIEVYERGFTLPAPLTFSDPDEVHRLSRQNEENLGASATSTLAARIGIFSHHGNTPHGIRLAVEYAMKEGLIRLVICTSTLAQGVNLPIRYLIITGANQGSERIKTRDFHNLLGRAGRSGMHTEGTVIFSDPQIYDGRNSEDNAWRWPLTKALLDPSKSEDCKSALLSVLDAVTSADQKLAVTLGVPLLVTAHSAGRDGWRKLAKRIIKEFPTRGFDEDDLLRQLLPKSDVMAAIEGFLMAHWSDEVGTDRLSVASLAESTLAFHLATELQRTRLIELFKTLSEQIAERVPEVSRRRVFSRSLFGLSDNIFIQNWVQAHATTLMARTGTSELLRDIWPLIERFVRNLAFQRCRPPAPLLALAEQWISGAPYSRLLDDLVAAGCRFGDKKLSKPIVENVVDVCESGLGFDGMLIIGAVAEMISLEWPDEAESIELLQLLQKQIKYGLTSPTAITLYELGFSDRVIAQEMAEMIIGPSARRRVIRRLEAMETDIRAFLSTYPRYFTTVLDALLA